MLISIISVITIILTSTHNDLKLGPAFLLDILG